MIRRKATFVLGAALVLLILLGLALSTRSSGAVPASSPLLAPFAARQPVAAPRSDPQGPMDLLFPIANYARENVRDTFADPRGDVNHEAIDLPAPRGTPVVAVSDGKIEKLFLSKPGGLTIYQFDPTRAYAFYYAHLDRYAPGLDEGQTVVRGQVIAFVGSTGNASPSDPHLHFTIYRLGPDRKWWRGEAINPYPALLRAVSR
ncbi:MAG: M23 family metallopeptidase [Bryobacteraceae bacterium]|nr:M23 family metallopeptidase [Bryobacteraceae bacterium]